MEVCAALCHLKHTRTWSSCCQYIKGKRSFVRTWLEWKLTDIKSVIRYFHIFHVRAQKVELACTLMNNKFCSFALFCFVLCCLLKHGAAWCDFVWPVGTQFKALSTQAKRMYKWTRNVTRTCRECFFWTSESRAPSLTCNVWSIVRHEPNLVSFLANTKGSCDDICTTILTVRCSLIWIGEWIIVQKELLDSFFCAYFIASKFCENSKILQI